MASKALIPFLIGMMLLTGVCNTLLTKYQDNQCVRNCDDRDPTRRHNFEQPVLQTAQMFVGEMGCWIVIGIFKIYRRYFGTTPDIEGYQSILTSPDSEVRLLDGEDSSVDAEDVNPLAKTLLKNPEDRIVLEGWRITLLSLPAICDICGTTLMNVGLLFVVASIYQMTRGALVLFVGLFSVLFLKRKLFLYQWAALVTVVLGVGIVGVAGATHKEEKISIPHDAMLALKDAAELAVREARTPEAIRTIVGILLIAGAQIFTATQFVLEEWILEKYALEPIKVVGWEGTFGFLITAAGMIVLHLTIGNTDDGRYGYFDMNEGLRQVFAYPAIGWTSLAIMFSIGGFNFFGLSVTRTVSATSRSTIDTCRTLFIWIVSLGLGWESFKWLQVLGFALLVYGTFLFNGIVRPPLQRCVERKQVLLPEEPIEHA